MAKRYSSENKNQTPNQKSKPIIKDNTDSVLKQNTGSPASFRWTVIPGAVLFIVLLSFAGSMDNSVEKVIGLLSAVISLAMLIAFRKTAAAKAYITPIFLSFTAYIIWGGISTLYAASGKFAIFEFSKLLFALCVYLAVLIFTDSEESGFNRISYMLASSGAFFGIISVDAASSKLLSNLFVSFTGLFTDVYAGRGAFEEGIRISGIFGNPNIYAGFMAIAVFFSLYLAINASNKKSAVVSTTLLAVNALSYLLAFSLGSLFMFLLSCLTMIAVSEKEKRINLFLLMIEAAILSLLFAMLSMGGLGKSGVVSFLPLLSLILNAFILYLVDSKLRLSFSRKFEESKKLSLRIVVLSIAFIAVYMIAAFNVSGELTLAENESVMRAIYVPGGDYTLTVDSSNPVNIMIQSQNETDLIRHTSSGLFGGTNQGEIKFTVPDDSRIVMLTFAGVEGGSKVHSASYSGSSDGIIHLKYPLLPNIIANRLQNLFANENMVQRGIFFEDGMKLFKKAPIIGRGLGGFENGVYSVQDFYYETKYAHNHYIQALCDLGIVGLVLFLSTLAFSASAIFQSKRKGHALFAIPVITASIFQAFGQAITDATWSAGVFLGFASVVLALLTKYLSKPIDFKSPELSGRMQLVEKAVLILFTCTFIVLLSGNLYAQAHAKAGVKSFKDIDRLIALDRFEYNDYKISYLVSAPKSEDSDVLTQAELYAEQLGTVPSNSIAPYLMTYNFETYMDVDAFEAAMKGIENAKSSPNMWMELFDVCERYIDPVGPYTDDASDRLRSPKYYINSVIDLYNALLERNKNSLDQISLSPYNQAFIGKMLELKAMNQYGVDWVFTVIMTYAFDSECAVDTDQNGIPDAITVKSGNIIRNENGLLSVSANTTLDFNLYQKLKGDYKFKVKTNTPEGITISLNGEALETVYDTKEAYAMVTAPDNTDHAISNFTVTFPQDTVIDEITYITKLPF